MISCPRRYVFLFKKKKDWIIKKWAIVKLKAFLTTELIAIATSLKHKPVTSEKSGKTPIR